MVKCIVEVPILPGKAEEYLEKLRPVVLNTRQEAGCLEYTVFWDEKSATATLMETFRDQAAADLHVTLPHFTQGMAALSCYYWGEPRVVKYADPVI